MFKGLQLQCFSCMFLLFSMVSHIITEPYNLQSDIWHVFTVQCIHSSSVSLLPPSSSEVAKKRTFEIFLLEAKQAFVKFRVLFLRGISLPTCYDDLLPAGKTNYACVDWHEKQRPASNLFSMDVKTLTKEEKKGVELSIKAYVIAVIEEAKIKFE